MGVRTLGPDEWELWRRLRLAALEDAPDAFLSTHAEESAKTDEFWSEIVEATTTHERGNLWVAEADGEPVGIAFGRLDPEMDFLTVAAMWVAPNARGAGHGAALLDAMSAWAGELGAKRAELWVTDGNEPAERLYERAGFERIGKPSPLREGSDLTVSRMARPLE